MATLKQRLRRKNSSDSYDIIYLQADLSNVTGTLAVSNGGTGTTSTSGIKTALSLPTDTASEINNLKSSVSNGKSLVAAAITDKGVSTASDATFQTMASNIRNISGEAYAYICTRYISGHTCTCSGNGKILTAPNTTGYWIFGVDGSGEYVLTDVESGFVRTVTINNQYQVENVIVMIQWIADCITGSVGSTIVTVDGYEWLLVDKTDITATLGLRYCYTQTPFGNNKYYAGSTIAGLCSTFENDLTTETKQWLNSVTVEGVTAKVWIPTYEQTYSGSFSGVGTLSHYSNDPNRIFKDSNGTATIWWTSSQYGTEKGVRGINKDGSHWSANCGNSYGFRPHMEVNINV